MEKETLSNTENAAEQAENEKKDTPSTGLPQEDYSNIAKIQDELTEAKDKYIRLYSEFENFRRRTSREKLDLVNTANEELIKSLLPVADDFERAEKAFEDKGDDSKEKEGFQLIHNKLKKVLEQYGVKPMDLGPGSNFNPDTQEAIAQTAVTAEKLKGKIVDVVEKGYTLHDKVIRFAKVIVGN